jgi:hypothetical protein
MEQITKNFKLIGGILVLISCILPFGTVGFGPFGISFSGFSLFSGNILSLLAILLIILGAAALIYVDVTKKDIELAPNFKLSFVAKLSPLVSGIAIFIWILTTAGIGVGFGLILEIIFALAIFFEKKVTQLLQNK